MTPLTPPIETVRLAWPLPGDIPLTEIAMFWPIWWTAFEEQMHVTLVDTPEWQVKNTPSAFADQVWTSRILVAEVSVRRFKPGTPQGAAWHLEACVPVCDECAPYASPAPIKRRTR